MNFHKKAVPPRGQEVAVKNADPALGLSADEAKLRTESGWANGLPTSAGKKESDIIIQNCLTFFNLVFVVLAVILALSGSSVKNMAFMIVVLCNTFIGCFQEIRAKRAVDKLTLVAAAQLHTVRDGAVVPVRSDLLVRDDIVEFTAGDQICADGILRAGELYVNEALVTGEEDAIHKLPGDKLLSGSFVVSGMGRAQLTKVGKDSFAARLALEAKADPKSVKSEMMRSLDRLIQVVGIALIPIGLVLFYQQFKALSLPLQTSVERTVSALVGMIPEGLYLLTSVAMAVSAIKLSRKRVLVQDMNCIETLARVDVLCVDKTGTITENRMEVENVIPLTDEPPERLEKILAAYHAGIQPDNETGRVMKEMFGGESDWVCTKRLPFDSGRKWSAAIFRGQGTFLIGAPEFAMGSRYGELQETVEQWTSRGSRVLLVAQYAGDPEEYYEPGKLHPLALVLLHNPIRPEAPETFSYFAQQGVAIKVISGDNPLTASQIALRAGIPGAERWVDAATLETEEDFLTAAEAYTVFGRVTPDKKKLLIRSLKKLRHTVAMTGDGVNDVLAMKEADCGIAMASGAQAASQIARLVLLDSDFSAMPGIVAEGRRVINNIQRAATLFLVKNIFSLGLSIISMFSGLAYPLIPLHLTVISALTIGIPSFFLAMEPNYERFRGHFLRGVLRRAFPGGLTNIFVVLMAQIFIAAFALPAEQTSTICAAVLGVVGLQVLFQVCKPFDFFRKLLWVAMGAAMVFCFTALAPFFELQAAGKESLLILTALLIMTPTVFFAVQRLFDWGDRIYLQIRNRKK